MKTESTDKITAPQGVACTDGLGTETECQIKALREEAALCRNETATDVAELLDDAANKIEELEKQYRRLHSQVGGYLHGEQWQHWQQYNAPEYAPSAESCYICGSRPGMPTPAKAICSRCMPNAKLTHGATP
jgi:hypothetical protein